MSTVDYNNEIVLWGVGGCGVNIGKESNDDVFKKVFVDGSDSNTKTLNENSNIFSVPGMRGAGKNRELAMRLFKPVLPKLLTQYKPSDRLNVVITSVSGGSGSTMGFMIARELLMMDKPVIIVGVITQGSDRELSNSRGTLESYNNTAIRLGKPISMFLADDPDRIKVNENIQQFLSSIELITNTEHTEEFDESDLKHFLDYTSVCDLPVGLTTLVAVINDEEIENHVDNKTKFIATSIIISKTGTAHSPHYRPKYAANIRVTLADYNLPDIRLDNIVGAIPEVIERLKQRELAAKEELEVASIKESEVVKPTFDIDDDFVM